MVAIRKCSGSLTVAIQHNRDHLIPGKLSQVVANRETFFTNNESEEVAKLKSQKELFDYEKERTETLKAVIKEKTGRTSQIKDYYIEGLLVLGREQLNQIKKDEKSYAKLQDKCKEFIYDFAKKHHTTIHAISLHLDEGHYDIYGKWNSNPHIQFVFDNVNHETGKAINSRLTRQDLRDLQTDLAEYIKDYGFVRGRDYKAEKQIPPKQKRVEKYKTEALNKSIANGSKTIEDRATLIDEFKKFLADEEITDLAQLKEIYKKQKDKIIQYGKDNPEDKVTKGEWDDINKELTEAKERIGELEKQITTQDTQITANSKITTRIEQYAIQLAKIDDKDEIKAISSEIIRILVESGEAKQEHYQAIKRLREAREEQIKQQLEEKLEKTKEEELAKKDEEIEGIKLESTGKDTKISTLTITNETLTTSLGTATGTIKNQQAILDNINELVESQYQTMGIERSILSEDTEKDYNRLKDEIDALFTKKDNQINNLIEYAIPAINQKIKEIADNVIYVFYGDYETVKSVKNHPQWYFDDVTAQLEEYKKIKSITNLYDASKYESQKYEGLTIADLVDHITEVTKIIAQGVQNFVRNIIKNFNENNNVSFEEQLKNEQKQLNAPIIRPKANERQH
jgi:cellobiose-specific phosphotransferase system component IIA